MSRVTAWLLVVAALVGSGLAAWLVWGHRWRPSDKPVNTSVEAPPAPEAALEGQGVDSPGMPGLTGHASALKPHVRGARLSGIVLEAETGTPVAGAVVHVVRTSPSMFWRQVTTDDTGAFEFQNLPEGAWIATVWHQAYLVPGLAEAVAAKSLDGAPEQLKFLVRSGSASPENLELRLESGARIEGTVVDVAGGPVPHASIQMASWGLAGMRRALSIPAEALDAVFAPKADAEGRFVLACLPSAHVETLRLAATTPGRAGTWVDAPGPEADGVRRVVLETALQAEIRGRVVFQDGTPVPDVLVEATYSARRDPWTGQSTSTKATASGTFHLSQLAPERDGLVVLWHDGRLVLTRILISPLLPGESRRLDDIVVPRAFDLDVRLRASDGRPLQGELLQLLGVDGPNWMDQGDPPRTDATGRARLSAVGPGPWALERVQPDRYMVLHQALNLPSGPLEFTVDPTPQVDVRIHLVDASGQDVPEFRAEACPVCAEDDNTTSWFVTSTQGRNGYASMTLYGPFPVELQVTTPSPAESVSRKGLARRLETPPEGGLVELQLGNALVGWVGDTAGSPVPGVTITLVHEGTGGRRVPVRVERDGTYRLPDGLERAGTVTLAVDAPDGYVDVQHVLFEGEDPPRIELAKTRRLFGRLVHPSEVPFSPGGRIAVVSLDSIGVERQFVDVAADGSFVVEDLPAGSELMIVVDSHWLATQDLQQPGWETLVSADAPSALILLDAVASIRGRVRGVVGTTPGIFVSARPLRGTSGIAVDSIDDSGNYAVAVPDSTEWVLSFLDSRRESTVLFARRTASAGAREVDVTHPGLDHILIAARDVEQAIAFPAGRHTSMSTELLLPDEGHKLTIVADSRVDVLLLNDWMDSTRAAFVRSVTPGSTVDVALAPTRRLAGRLVAHLADGHDLVLAGPAGTFPLDVGELDFSASVLPGVYDLILVDRAGEERVIKRGLIAGRVDYKVDPR